MPRTYDSEFRRRVVDLLRTGRSVAAVRVIWIWPRPRSIGGKLRI